LGEGRLKVFLRHRTRGCGGSRSRFSISGLTATLVSQPNEWGE
jgi:hypothetical protein